MSDEMCRKVTFLTPTYARDFERFYLQRESIEKFNINIPQVAVVHDEDLNLFNSIPYQRNLTILSTCDVLPPDIELRRRNKFDVKSISNQINGWVTQQLVKLASPKVIKTEAIVCLDSDVVFLRNVDCKDFYSLDGKLHLAEMKEHYSEWFDQSWHFLGLPHNKKQYYNYVFMLVPFHRQVLLDLQLYISNKYNEPWADAIVKGEVTEYMTYGIFARYINQLKFLSTTNPTLCFTVWSGMEKNINKVLQDITRISQIKAISIQSSIGWSVHFYRQIIEQAWATHGKVN